jgi:transcriptional regulator of NAD metabolism
MKRKIPPFNPNYNRAPIPNVRKKLTSNGARLVILCERCRSIIVSEICALKTSLIETPELRARYCKKGRWVLYCSDWCQRKHEHKPLLEARKIEPRFW